MMIRRQLSHICQPVTRRDGCAHIALLAVVLFTLPGQAAESSYHPPTLDSQPASTILARVNGEPVTEQMVLRRLRAVHGDVEPYRQDPGRWQRMLEAGIDAEIRDQLLLQAATAEKLKVSDQEVQEARERTLKLLGEDRFQSMLDERGATEADYAKFLRERLLIDKYKAQLFEDISLDEKILRSYYSGHTELFRQPRRAHLESVLARNPRSAKKSLEALESGNDDEALSRQNGGQGSTTENAQRVWVVVDDLPPELRTSLETAKVGEVLELDEEAGNRRIIRLLAVEKARRLSFDEARKGLEVNFLRRRQETLLDDWYARASKQASIEFLPLP